MRSDTMEVRRASRWYSFYGRVAARSRGHGPFRRWFVRCANVRMAVVGRETASLMSAISSRPGMNSRAAGSRSHRSRIRSRKAVSTRDAMIEDADQGKQGGVGDRLIPVIENRVERRLALHGADEGAENDRHPQQRREASAKADAAERR